MRGTCGGRWCRMRDRSPLWRGSLPLCGEIRQRDGLRILRGAGGEQEGRSLGGATVWNEGPQSVSGSE